MLAMSKWGSSGLCWQSAASQWWGWQRGRASTLADKALATQSPQQRTLVSCVAVCTAIISGAPLHSSVAHAGNAEVSAEIASELLRASDQYLLEGLKRLCEMRIAQSLSLDTLIPTFELSEAFSAPQLARRCILFVLEHYDAFLEMHGADMLHDLMLRMVPQVRQSMLEDTAEQPPSQES